MKITAADFEEVVRKAVNQRMQIAGSGGSPGQPYTPPKEDPKNPYVPAPPRKLAGNPSFDINETPATRRIRKIRGLQERGVGGEKGNAGDILKKGVQLPNLQAGATSRQIRDRLRPFTSGGPADYDTEGGSLRGVPDALRIQLLRDAMAQNKLSTPHWDKQKKIQDYLKNDDKLRERGLLGGVQKA